MGAQRTSPPAAVRPAPKVHKKWPHKCKTKFCRHRVWKSGHSPFCNKCKAKAWRERFPLHRRWSQLKWRAKARGHAFALTRDQFVAWCRSVGYTGAGGKTITSPSIDRIDAARGYEPGNLQLLTLAENSRKSYVERRLMALYGEPAS